MDELDKKRLDLAVIGESEWPLLEALFLEVFGHPLERALTRWKYASDHGLAIAMVDHAACGPRAVAHCGLMFRDIVAAGRLGRAAQMTDLMVAPDHRGGMMRAASPFAKVVKSAYARIEAAKKQEEPARIVFGFPSARAMRLGQRLGLFVEVDHVDELSWSPQASVCPPRVTARDASFDDAVHTCWEAMRSEFAHARIGVRDAPWLARRYLDHPTKDYRIHLVRSRWLQRPRAVFVLREIGSCVELLDWVAPREEAAAMLDAARAVAASLGANRLFAWLTRSQLLWFDGSGANVRPTEFGILGRGDLSRHELDQDRNGWWLTSGDTDYR